MQIEINNLSKKYGKKTALENISLTIASGMYGLLGRNGAGKTSLMRIIATLSEPTDGEVKINGISIRKADEIRRIVGYLPQDFSFYKNMSVYSAMDYLGLLSGLDSKVRKERIVSLLEQVNLSENIRTKVRALSGGMRRRLGIAQALLHNPQVLVVDEPTAGLDPEERIRFRNLLCEFAEDRIVLLSTHIASDIESTCENVGVLDEGKLIFDGSTDELIHKANGKVFLITSPKKMDKQIKDNYCVLNINSTHAGTQYRVLSDTLPEVKSFSNAANIELPTVEAIAQDSITLEDGYMCLINGLKGGVHR